MFNQSAELKRIFVKALIILPLNEYEVQEKKCFVTSRSRCNFGGKIKDRTSVQWTQGIKS